MQQIPKACVCASAPFVDVASAPVVCHDHGSQHVSDAFQSELRFLRIDGSPASVRVPEGNGRAERLIRTLKENLL